MAVLAAATLAEPSSSVSLPAIHPAAKAQQQEVRRALVAGQDGGERGTRAGVRDDLAPLDFKLRQHIKTSSLWHRSLLLPPQSSPRTSKPLAAAAAGPKGAGRLASAASMPVLVAGKGSPSGLMDCKCGQKVCVWGVQAGENAPCTCNLDWGKQGPGVSCLSLQ